MLLGEDQVCAFLQSMIFCINATEMTYTSTNEMPKTLDLYPTQMNLSTGGSLKGYYMFIKLINSFYLRSFLNCILFPLQSFLGTREEHILSFY